MELLIIFAVVIQVVIILMFALHAAVEHGISENNLIITLLNSMRGFVWPIILLLALRRAYPDFKKRVVKDWKELRPKRELLPIRPLPISVTELPESEQKYTPGSWVN